MITIILATTVVIALGLFQYFSQKRPPNFPPGPIGVPLLGYAPFLRLPLYKAFDDLTKKYGNVCSFYLMNNPVVLLGDAKAVKEGFGNDRMIARPKLKILEYSGYGDGRDRGFVSISGKRWQVQRRFVFKNLRQFGIGKSKMEGLIMAEIVDLIKGLKNVVNQSVDVQDRFRIAVFNSFWYIISGEKYTHDDQKLTRFVEKILEQTTITLSACLFLMPWVVKAFPKLSGLDSFITTRDEIFEFIKEVVEDHKKTLDINNPRDFIDAYLREIKLTTDPNSTFYKEEGERQMLFVLLELFGTGSTPALPINWTILYLMTHPDVQKKVHVEIDSVVGIGRNPSLSDRPRMPYMEAVITESLRFSTLAVFGAPHATTDAVEFNGYTIPENTIIIGNFKSIHFDKEFWGDPENFRPERFIDDDGQYKGSNGTYAFSVGKRMCPAENMARDQMFLFLAGLLQEFHFEVDINKPPTLEPIPNLMGSEHWPYNVIIRDRNSKEST